MKEVVSINIERYRDSKGRHTCAADFKTGNVCQFLRVARFGSVDVCVLAPIGHHHSEPLNRRLDEKGDPLGFLIPNQFCIFNEASMSHAS